MSVEPVRILFGSKNPSKFRRMRELFREIGVELVSASDLAMPEADEGDSIERNAAVKARAYAGATGRSCIANDYGLRVEGLSDAEQPGPHVRRINKTDAKVTDEQLLAFYAERINRLGGETIGTWTCALALAFDADRVVLEVAQHSRRFVGAPSGVILPSEPLASLQIDPVSGRYVSELTFSGRAARPSVMDQAFLDFVSKQLELGPLGPI